MLRKILRDVWSFIWHDDSILSWIVNIVLAFILIKYIVYPLLGLLLGTSFPIVAVVSESMEHGEKFDDWWKDNGQLYSDQNITKEDFNKFYFKNGFDKGDIIFLIHRKPEEIYVGDVIVFMSHRQSPRPDPIIHRVVNKWEDINGIHFRTKGDNNGRSIDDCDSTGCINEEDILPEQVMGRAIGRIPYLGWIKILFVDYIGAPYCKITDNLYPCRAQGGL